MDSLYASNYAWKCPIWYRIDFREKVAMHKEICSKCSFLLSMFGHLHFYKKLRLNKCQDYNQLCIFGFIFRSMNIWPPFLEFDFSRFPCFLTFLDSFFCENKPFQISFLLISRSLFDQKHWKSMFIFWTPPLQRKTRLNIKISIILLRGGHLSHPRA